ncbi:MAG: hypothetical protein QM572_03890 [Nocardioides sp.]|uniref:hypothetical protein n=1 Tax=Nocardioides sp. TaxID=35761 RepID=UPI0039E2D681
MDPGLPESLGLALQRALRRAVLDLATAERRPVFVPRLHLGIPGGAGVVHALLPEERTDHALRTDVVAAMTARLGNRVHPMVWLTRPGELDPVQDLEQQWLAGAVQAYAEQGRRLVFVTVNRHGWRDPRSGAFRHWARLRERD